MEKCPKTNNKIGAVCCDTNMIIALEMITNRSEIRYVKK